jgi:hypothetical protein
MRSAVWVTLPLALPFVAAPLAFGCGETTTTAVRGQLEDASASAGGSRGTARDAGAFDASSVHAGACDAGLVFDVMQSRGPESSAEAGGPPLIRIVDGGFVHSLPTDPCVTYVRRDCPGDPRSVFGCPSVVGPSGSSGIHPGDQITVRVPITDDGLAAYSCFGVSTEQYLAGGSALTYAVRPAYVMVSGQVPASAKPRTIYHFTAMASGSRYTSGSACENDLTQLDFDVSVE